MGSGRSQTGLDVLWPFFAFCLVGASAANDRTLLSPVGLGLLTSWALWSRRPRSATAMQWAACWLVAAMIGLAGYRGLFWFRSAVQNFETSLVSRFASGKLIDSRESRTMLGSVGLLKLSGRIVLRVETEKGQAPPELLREASYTQFRAPYWTATAREFGTITSDPDETTWRLLRSEEHVPLTQGVAEPSDSGSRMPPSADKISAQPLQSRTRREVAISGFLSGGEGLLALPLGVTRLAELPVFVIETNRLGAVRVASGPGFARFRAVFENGSAIDSPPDTNDLEVPSAEASALAQLASELNLAQRAPEDVLPIVTDLFSSQFRYSLELGKEDTAPFKQTSLSAFLLKSRSGHCEYFATATVLLLRQAGIPARYAVGYSVQERKGKQWIVRSRHAHAWCLAWVNGAWRDVDATPAGWSETEAAGVASWEKISDVWSRIWFAVAEWRWGKGGWKRYLIWLTVPLVLLAGWRFLSQKQWRRGASQNPAKRTPVAWPGLDSEFYWVEKRLAEMGCRRNACETQSRWLMRIGQFAWANTTELQELLALHYRLRFDPSGLSAADRTAMKRAAADWIIRSRRDSSPGSMVRCGDLPPKPGFQSGHRCATLAADGNVRRSN